MFTLVGHNLFNILVITLLKFDNNRLAKVCLFSELQNFLFKKIGYSAVLQRVAHLVRKSKSLG